MMPTIRIDDDVWKFLQSKARAFEDSPNDVLRRELKIVTRPVAASGDPVHTQDSFRPDKDYTHLRVNGYRLQGRFTACRSFKEVLVRLCDELRGVDASSFDTVALQLRGRKRPYFSHKAGELRMPEQLKDTSLSVETNLNANILVGLCRAILRGLNRDPDSFEVDAA